MENKPLVSIIITAYNSEAFLEACLLSVQEQTYPHWECLVVDDGSEDGTLAIAQAMAARDKRFQALHIPHAGVSCGRNQCLSKASGEFVTFLDSDDRYACNFLEHALEKLGKADLFIAGIRNVMVDAAGVETELEAWTIPQLHFTSGAAVAQYYIKEHKLLLYSNCNKLYRRSILTAQQIRFDESLEFGEDRVFNYAYLQQVKEVVTTDKCCYFYYHRDRTSLSTKFRSFHMQELVHLHEAKMHWLNKVLGAAHEEELARFVEYDITKEYRNAQAMLERYKGELSEEVLHAEYEVLNSVREKYAFLNEAAGTK